MRAISRALQASGVRLLSGKSLRALRRVAVARAFSSSGIGVRRSSPNAVPSHAFTTAAADDKLMTALRGVVHPRLGKDVVALGMCAVVAAPAAAGAAATVELRLDEYYRELKAKIMVRALVCSLCFVPRPFGSCCWSG